MNQTASPPNPVVPYTALVGQVLLRHREERQLNQSELATALNLSQSAYSRIEQGNTTISVAQLRVISRRLGVAPSDILREADSLTESLRLQGVAVSDEKGVSPAAVVIGLGILAALLMAKK